MGMNRGRLITFAAPKGRGTQADFAYGSAHKGEDAIVPARTGKGPEAFAPQKTAENKKITAVAQQTKEMMQKFAQQQVKVEKHLQQ